MHATVIDTLRYADRLKASGFEPRQAEGLARALGDELAESLVTKMDLQNALKPIEDRLSGVEFHVGGLYDNINALDAKMDAQYQELGARMEAQYRELGARMEVQYRELNGKFNMLMTIMALGFTVLVGLGLYGVVAPRSLIASPAPQSLVVPAKPESVIGGAFSSLAPVQVAHAVDPAARA